MPRLPKVPKNCRTPAYAGFTLIELLVVVAIIAILAAIALPNFLEAQVRSKIARVKTDMRSIATGLEAYAADYTRYPPMMDFPDNIDWKTPAALLTPPFHSRVPSYLTTPVSYMSSIPNDPFGAGSVPSGIFLAQFEKRQVYFNFAQFRASQESTYVGSNFDIADDLAGDWLMYSVGPDIDPFNGGGNIGVYRDYDPTNGTLSEGNIFRTKKNSTELGFDSFFYP